MILPAVWPKSKFPHGPEPPGYAPAGLKMFGCVAVNAVYRSGQPTAEGFRWLKDRGFRTIVSLRAEGDGDADYARDSGLVLHRLPWQDEASPPGDGAAALLEIVSESDAWPLLLHCKAGRGRTSVAAGILRHSLDGWDYAAIMEEVRLYRLWVFGVVHVPLAKVQREWLREYCR